MSSGSLQVMLAMFRWHRKDPVETVQRDLAGMHVVFTGGTDGMGRVAVGRLAQMNANLHVLGRNPEKTARAVDELNRSNGAGRAVAIPCDLSSLSSVPRRRRFAAGTVSADRFADQLRRRQLVGEARFR